MQVTLVLRGGYRKVRNAARHPITYLFVYLALIPIFAALYCSLPFKSFYAPDAKYEPAAYADAERLRQALANTFHRALPKQKSHTDRLPWSIDPRSLSVGQIETTDLLTLRTAVKGTVDLFDVNGNQIGAEQFSVPFELNLDEYHRTDSSGFEREPRILTEPSLPYVDDDQVLLDLFPRMEVSGHQRDLTLTSKEDERFRNFMIAQSGEPFALSDARSRMFYFSATTITTTGFGDIVPLTTKARLLAGTEAVLGWIVAGLFLNAVARRRG